MKSEKYCYYEILAKNSWKSKFLNFPSIMSLTFRIKQLIYLTLINFALILEMIIQVQYVLIKRLKRLFSLSIFERNQTLNSIYVDDFY